MNSRRTVIIGAAIMLALLAFLGNVMYLRSVKDAAYKNVTLVDTYVVAKEIPKGTAGDLAADQSFVRVGRIPLEFKPGTAIKNTDDIRNKVAITDLHPGQVVVEGQFVDESVAQVTFAQRVSPNRVAVTVSLDQVHGVAGLLMPGDLVNILVVTNSENTGAAQVMYQNVKILAIGAKAAPRAGESTSETDSAQSAVDSGLITFEVPLDAAQRIALISSGVGGTSLYLTLVPPNNAPVDPKPARVDTSNVLNNLPVTPY